MKQIIGVLFSFALLAQEAEAPAPVVAWNKVNVARLKAMGVPGITPFTRDHVLVIVETKRPEATIARVCVTFEGEENELVRSCVVAEFNETRQAAAMVTDGFREIDVVKVVRIQVEELRTESLGTSEVSAQ